MFDITKHALAFKGSQLSATLHFTTLPNPLSMELVVFPDISCSRARHRSAVGLDGQLSVS